MTPVSVTPVSGGNPQARNLFEIIACLQEREGLHLEVQAVRAANNAITQA